jgi:hypothetical protein
LPRAAKSGEPLIASTIARAIRSRNRPSAKQAAQGERVYEKAIQKGFTLAATRAV